jgi:hypothetical protein
MSKISLYGYNLTLRKDLKGGSKTKSTPKHHRTHINIKNSYPWTRKETEVDRYEIKLVNVPSYIILIVSYTCFTLFKTNQEE